MMILAKNLSAVLLCMMMVSCQTGKYFDTKESIKPEDALLERVHKDVVVTIQNNFLPAKTRIYFPHGDEKIATALEDSLRKYGYAISTDQKKGKQKGEVQLAYKFSEIESGLFVLRVVVGEGFQINRLYEQKKDGEFLAAGPLLMRKE